MTDREIMLSAEQRIDELMNKMLGSDPVSKKQVLRNSKQSKSLFIRLPHLLLITRSLSIIWMIIF